MNRSAIILHRGVRPLPLAHMGRHDPDAAFDRSDDLRKADNLRRTEQATRIARVANDRFEGPPRSYRIEPPLWFKLYIAVAFVASVFLVVTA